ncbi:alpha/beta hydrolase [Alteriqipengyuania sp.]|uniref:alpha/beta hydrolase n=1 Tax=Alteriqipengyuania sp. TaxID=2800692 RepID=UPI0035174817
MGWAFRSTPTLLLAAALGLSGCAGIIRDRIYQPRTLAESEIAYSGVAPSAVQVTAADGLTLDGYYWAPVAGNDTLVVYFHGNSGNHLEAAARAEPLTEGGHGVLVASYRGYGDNPGSPTEEGLFADADAWMAEARRLAPESKLFVFGHSLGGAVALEMAVRHDTAGVTTLGTFSRLSAAAPSYARGILPDRFDNIAAIKRVSEPILLLHGTEDEVVGFVNGERLAQANPRATFIVLPGAGHTVDMRLLAGRLWAAWENPSNGGRQEWLPPTMD